MCQKHQIDQAYYETLICHAEFKSTFEGRLLEVTFLFCLCTFETDVCHIIHVFGYDCTGTSIINNIQNINNFTFRKFSHLSS